MVGRTIWRTLDSPRTGRLRLGCHRNPADPSPIKMNVSKAPDIPCMIHRCCSTATRRIDTSPRVPMPLMEAWRLNRVHRKLVQDASSQMRRYSTDRRSRAHLSVQHSVVTSGGHSLSPHPLRGRLSLGGSHTLCTGNGFPGESEKFCTLACPTPGSEGTPGSAMLVSLCDAT